MPASLFVRDRKVQDEARDVICEAFESMGCTCKVIDRRENPTYGYRAVHVIVYWDGIPVESQIRTELQDTWAQIVERMGDRWGRGLRYGEDPEDPDAEVVASGLAITRREAMQEVGQLGDLIAQGEEARLGILPVETLDKMSQIGIEFEQKAADNERTVGATASPDVQDAFDQLLSQAPQIWAALTGWRDMTVRDFARAIRSGTDSARAAHDRGAQGLNDVDQGLRDMLQALAAATEHG